MVYRTRKQTLIATFSEKSKYIVMFDCVKKVRWMRNLFWKMAYNKPWPKEERKFETTEVYMDSDAAFSILLNKQASATIKHIPLKFHFVKNCIARGEVVLLSLLSKENIADMLTKILDFSTMKHLCDLMGLS